MTVHSSPEQDFDAADIDLGDSDKLGFGANSPDGDVSVTFDPTKGSSGALVFTDEVNSLEVVRHELDSEVVVNEDGADVDYRVESTNETGMLFVDAAENQAVIHGTSDPNYGALFVQGRASGSGADNDIVATLGEDDENIQLNGNNTGTVQNVQVQAGNWTSNNPVSPTNAVNFRVEGVPTFGSNVTPSNVYAMLVQNRAGDADWFRITDTGKVEVPTKGVDLQGGDLQRNGTAVVGTQESAIASLTNNQTATTTDGTLESIGDTSSGDQSAAIERNISEANSKVDAVLTALRNHGLIAT